MNNLIFSDVWKVCLAEEMQRWEDITAPVVLIPQPRHLLPAGVITVGYLARLTSANQILVHNSQDTGHGHGHEMFLGINRGRVSMPCWVSSVWLESILFRHRNELVWNVSRITSDLGEVSSDNFDRNILDMILLPSSVFSRYEGKLYYKAVRNGTSSHHINHIKQVFLQKV